MTIEYVTALITSPIIRSSVEQRASEISITCGDFGRNTPSVLFDSSTFPLRYSDEVSKLIITCAITKMRQVHFQISNST